MRLLFMVLSTAYISGIFLFADSPMVSDIAPYNPYSLLHIPLYGILTVLLVLAFIPLKGIHLTKKAQVTATNLTKLSSPANWTFEISPGDRINPATRLFLAGFIAFWVAIADELHQSFIPGRDGSITDVFLDIGGIILVILYVRRLCKNR